MATLGRNNYVIALHCCPNQILVMNDRNLIIKNPCIDSDCDGCGK